MAGASGNPKNPAWYSGGLAAALGPGAGNVFYVNGGSDGPVIDTGSGLTPDDPKQLLQSAIDLCTNENNDYVIVLNYGGNARAVEAWPVEVNKTMCHIIGVGDRAAKWPLVSSDDDNPALLITADRVEVTNMNLGGGATTGAIHIGDAGGTWGANIHDCFFGVEGTAQDGIRIPAGTAAPYLTVTNCRFDQGLTRDGIRFEGNATRCYIGLPGNGNIFRNLDSGSGGIGINLTMGVTEPGIFDNIFAIDADTAGAAITFAAGVVDGMIDGNRAGYGDTAGNNMFVDGAAADANNWLTNYSGIVMTYPA